MARFSRREFLQQQSVGLAAGVAGLALTLRTDAQPTLSSRHLKITDDVRPQLDAGETAARLKESAQITKPTGYGPFYSVGAPFRAKSCSPFEPGTKLLVSGRIWGYDTKKPLSAAVIDIWHSDIKGDYSTGKDFRNRTRLISSETGSYEFEAIHPVAYAVDNGSWWRSPHIHFKVACPGYVTIVTELYFEGDKLHEQDKVFQPALMMPVQKREDHDHAYEAVVFDIVLEQGKGIRGG
jgi:catechol 1,2-dioxygenase